MSKFITGIKANQLKSLLKQIDSVITDKMTRTERWYKVVDVGCKFSANIRRDVASVIEDNRAKRTLLFNDLGKTKTKGSSNLRWGLSMPNSVYQLLMIIEPNLLRGSKEKSQKDLYALMKAFPVFKIPSKI